MKQWFGPLSLRYKLTFSALAVEALMFAFLIGSGMQSTSLALQRQAEQRVQEIAKTLAVALQAPLSQRDDASVRDLAESLRGNGLNMIEVRDSEQRIVHQVGVQVAGGAQAADLDLPDARPFQLDAVGRPQVEVAAAATVCRSLGLRPPLVLDIGLDHQKAVMLLRQGRVVLKRCDTVVEAQRLAEKFDRSGAICIIEDRLTRDGASGQAGSGESSLVKLINKFIPASRQTGANPASRK